MLNLAQFKKSSSDFLTVEDIKDYDMVRARVEKLEIVEVGEYDFETNQRNNNKKVPTPRITLALEFDPFNTKILDLNSSNLQAILGYLEGKGIDTSNVPENAVNGLIVRLIAIESKRAKKGKSISLGISSNQSWEHAKPELTQKPSNEVNSGGDTDGFHVTLNEIKALIDEITPFALMDTQKNMSFYPTEKYGNVLLWPIAKLSGQKQSQLDAYGAKLVHCKSLLPKPHTDNDDDFGGLIDEL